VAQLWYVDQKGNIDGPLTATELRTRAADGRLLPADRISPDGRRWVAASRVKGLQFESAAVTPVATVPTIILPPTIEPDAAAISLPGYDVQAIIGSGACGVVYRATQLCLNRVVALKTVHLQTSTPGTALTRFEREAVALAKLQHPNIVGVFDYGHHDGRVYMAMELLDGEDLERRIKRLGRLDERTAWTIARQTSVALAHAAKLGITHRDIKPANLFLVPPPSGFGLPEDLPMVKVMDFGLAFTKRTDDDRLTRVGVVVGTPAYMAPEQFAHPDVDHRADIYALGATVYHSLAGHPPFSGSTVWEMIAKKGESAPRLASGVSTESAQLVAAMLTPEPERRVADYDDLIRRIDALLGMTRTTAGPPDRRKSFPVRKAGIVAGLAVVVSVLLATILASSGPRLASGPPPAVAAAGRPEVLSDRANFTSWEKEGKVTFEPDAEGVQVLTTSGSVRWAFRPSASDRLSVGLDPHRAETVDLLFADGLGLRISRTDGVAAGVFRPDGTFRPLTPVAPYPAAETREGLVPYLSLEVQRIGNRWDLWFDHKHVGGIRTADPATGRLQLRTDGRAVRVERVELERLRAID
jgi:eukaryotic-like serine/threonine-protein kinase